VVNRLQLPVAAAQGMWLRSTIKLAPPATGPTQGTMGTTSRPPLRIAVLGDSTAAGCGVHTHDEGFTGSLAREIAARTQRPVEWQVAGQLGATARRIRYRLLPQLLPRLAEEIDAAVLLAGANDVLTGRRPEVWRDDLEAIVDDLMERAGHVIIAGVPPFALFPSIPPTLGRYLSERAAAFDEVSRQVCARRPCATWVTMTEIPPPEYFAVDRFHLSAAGYRRWAQVIADRLAL
jgi:lysophospholipase L1-like esterase